MRAPWKRKRAGPPVARPVVIPFFTDTHPNSTVGLIAPGGVALDDGGWYRPSKVQLSLWDAYLEYWSIVESWANQINAEVYAMFGGDGTDDNKHSKYQLVTVNEATAVKTSIATFEPALDIATKLFYNRGTEAHVGGSGALEELIAREIGAEKDPNAHNENHSQWYWELKVHGVRMLFAHHPFSSSWMPWTEGAGANRCAMAMELDYRRAEKKPPHFGAFGHTHHYEGSGDTHDVQTFLSPSWCVAGAFVHRLGKGWMFNSIGALIFTIWPDGRWEHRKFLRQPKRRKPWVKTTDT